MSIHILLTGILHKDAIPRIGQSGKEFTTASIRVEVDGQTTWANVIAFDQDSQDELRRLKAGDALSIQGKAKVGIYEKNGEHRASLDVTAYHVIGLAPKPKPKPKAKPRTGPAPYRGTRQADNASPADDDFDDPITF